MEFLVSWCSIESHTFKVAWGVLNNSRRCFGLTSLPLFRETRATKLTEDIVEVALDEEGKRKLEALKKALSNS